MIKLLNSDQLKREIIEAVIHLSSRTPLYSIRLEDIANFINEKYRLDEKSGYRTGSIMAALNRALAASLLQLEDSNEKKKATLAKQIKELDDYLLRTKNEEKRIKRVGRWRRSSLLIWFLVHEYIWGKFSSIMAVAGFNINPILKLKLITEHFLNFLLPQNSADNEMAEGIREILIVEGTMPIGAKKNLPDRSSRWVEPLSPFWVNFTKLLDQLITELQERKIFIPDFNARALRQAILGVMVYQALGQTIAERTNFSEDNSAEHPLVQMIIAIRQICFGFCPDENARQEVAKEWPV